MKCKLEMGHIFLTFLYVIFLYFLKVWTVGAKLFVQIYIFPFWKKKYTLNVKKCVLQNEPSIKNYMRQTSKWFTRPSYTPKIYHL